MRSIVLTFAFATTLSSASAAPQSQNDCSTSVMNNNYGKQRSALSLQAPVSSVETEISLRRLEERYCLQFATCRLADQLRQTKQANDQMSTWMLASNFDSCLRDEALEKYDAVESNPSAKRRRRR
jgi:hypothetical protein